jgi:hypothetical protein
MRRGITTLLSNVFVEIVSMGIEVDLSRSRVQFDQSLMPNDGQKGIGYTMQSFSIRFGLSFHQNANIGIGGAPSEAELWSIGIVQNVVFRRYLFEYGQGQIISTEFKNPAVDIVEGTFDKPFYSSPDFTKGSRSTRPVAHFWYRPQASNIPSSWTCGTSQRETR